MIHQFNQWKIGIDLQICLLGSIHRSKSWGSFQNIVLQETNDPYKRSFYLSLPLFISISSSLNLQSNL